MTTTTERQNPALRRIYSAAIKLFAETGATQLRISDLAEAAGVARGTVYNNLGDGDTLFEDVAEDLVSEMSARVTRSFAGIDDPAVRMSHAVRHYVRRAHEEPDWGRFVARFAHSNRAMARLWQSGPGLNLQAGIALGRYSVRPEQMRSVLGMLTGGVVGAMITVLDGELTWRVAGSDTAELLLTALGIERGEAGAIATMELPPLPVL